MSLHLESRYGDISPERKAELLRTFAVLASEGSLAKFRAFMEGLLENSAEQLFVGQFCHFLNVDIEGGTVTLSEAGHQYFSVRFPDARGK